MSEATDLYFPDAAIVLGETAAIPLVRPTHEGAWRCFCLPARQRRTLTMCAMKSASCFVWRP
jgi:hypothetical protein